MENIIDTWHPDSIDLCQLLKGKRPSTTPINPCDVEAECRHHKETGHNQRQRR